jgi:hypothetical protein
MDSSLGTDQEPEFVQKSGLGCWSFPIPCPLFTHRNWQCSVSSAPIPRKHLLNLVWHLTFSRYSAISCWMNDLQEPGKGFNLAGGESSIIIILPRDCVWMKSEIIEVDLDKSPFGISIFPSYRIQPQQRVQEPLAFLKVWQTEPPIPSLLQVSIPCPIPSPQSLPITFIQHFPSGW